MTHILSVSVLNKPGVLTRVAGLFSRRNFNIESLNVGKTENPEISRMTIVVRGDQKVLEQVTKQLHKLINVLKITELDKNAIVERDLILIRVKCTRKQRSEIIQIADTFRAQIVDVAPDSLMIEATGTEDKLEALTELLRDFGIAEFVRTGRVALSRGQAIK
ncbi:MAG: acetolactate synthase I/III small subunit [Halanaerobium sp. 4-GBenrich]|jgi:acetolactate synthase-1/3 small subunit|uniref:Acetolactate synthase small subunit n=1 Tax=Halanaerobium congolense TaxID=54121 RepID=A0A1G6HY76_9FIRM|nr:acetolactate synthase small subunit [Halanaerobium congolense]KXS50498.1 MAG: acetolactate synthase I/III small subunit [Halanaerobium sp. T82-1]ODS50377.1 MAG: acetolactate synthase I/III small subunit [Halanaerobium sp. 4-GBenrich]OEG62016.1 MAG: acetolactate synthase small subunit [Halanaerobium sp. MDAL1]PUU90939.1 MAG: acetolactate synthase I/III small subunit [Halanaerobium sp.]PTX17011.1 acetolactate synthase small subunit [Halanaerobium congolense]